MNYIPELLAPGVTQALGWTILHSLWQSSLIAIFLGVAMLLLHRHSAHCRYRITIGALFLNLVLAGITFNYYYRVHSGENITQPVGIPDTNYALAPVIAPDKTSFTYFSETVTYFAEHLPLVVTLWLLGMALMLIRFIGGLAYLQRLKSYKAKPVTFPWQNRLHHLQQQLKIKKLVRLSESALIQTPLVIGFLKPIILLPLGTLADLPAAQVEAILAHELAHLKRHDYFFNLLQSLTEVIFFYHPAIWWISDYVRIERENCCDDQAVAVCGDSVTYARALAALAERIPATPSLALAFAGKDGSLLARIRRQIQQQHTRPSFTDGFVAATVLLLSISLLSATALANLSPKSEGSLAIAPANISAAALVPSAFLPDPGAIPDSVPPTTDLVIVKNKKGKITEVYVDGQKIPQDKLSDYANRINQALAIQQKGGKTNPADTESLHKADVAVSRLNRQLKPVPTLSAPPIPPAPPAPGAEPPVAPPPPPPAPAKGSFFKGELADEHFDFAQLHLKLDSTFSELEKGRKVQEETFRKEELALQVQLSNLNKNLHLNQNLAKAHAKLATEQAKLSKLHAASIDKLKAELKKDGLYKEGENQSIKLNNRGFFIDGKEIPAPVFRKYKKFLPYPEEDSVDQSIQLNSK